MKTRIRCTEITVNGIVTKEYRAEVFYLWHNMASSFWSPAIGMLEDLDREVFWADEAERTEMFGGHPPKSRERAQALIDRLWSRYNYQKACKIEAKERQRQIKRTKRVTFEGYPEDQ